MRARDRHPDRSLVEFKRGEAVEADHRGRIKEKNGTEFHDNL
jgi:hypothetical protein